MNSQRIYLILIILFILVIPIHSFPQNQENSKLNFYIDFAQFKGNEEVNILEIYYSIPRSLISHVETEEGILGEYKFNCKIYHDDSLLDEKNWSGKDFAKSYAQILPNQTVNDYHLLLLKPNEYQIELTFFDNNNEPKFIKNEHILIEDFNVKSLKLSSLQLCTQIERTESENHFVKNGYHLTSNPSTVFGVERPILYYYCEIYNLVDLNVNLDSTYSTFDIIKNSNGEIINKLPSKLKDRLGNSLVQIGQFPTDGLHSGAYELELVVIDNSNNDTARTSKRFFIYRPSDYIGSKENYEKKDNIAQEIFLGFSEEELDYEFELAKYISTPEETDMYEDLNLVGKRELLAKFWTVRNRGNPDIRKDFRQDYLERVEYANVRYSVGGKEGWKTDPGRIILVYAIPDEFEKYTSAATMNQYEIWEYYNIQGGIEFVFVDVSGYGELRLVHSTSVNEIQDYDWQQKYLSQ